jgi:hypothetical protein
MRVQLLQHFLSYEAWHWNLAARKVLAVDEWPLRDGGPTVSAHNSKNARNAPIQVPIVAGATAKVRLCARNGRTSWRSMACGVQSGSASAR